MRYYKLDANGNKLFAPIIITPEQAKRSGVINGNNLLDKLIMIHFVKGASRFVILIGAYAIKLPLVSRSSAYGLWSGFIGGMQANIQETIFSRAYRHIAPLAPVLLSAPLGLFVVMPRCAPLEYILTEAEMKQIVVTEEYTLPVEMKQESFGILRNRLVALDYG